MLRVLVLAFSFSSLAALTLVSRATQRRRNELVSHGVFASVFVTLLATVGPWSTVSLAVVGLGAAVLAVVRTS